MSARVSAVGSSDCAAPLRLPGLLSILDRITRRVGAHRLRLPVRGRLLSLRLLSAPAPVLALAALPNVESFVAENGGQAQRRPATIVDAPPALAAEMARREATSIEPPPTHVALLNHAYVRDGVVEAADGTIVAESLINREPADRPLPCSEAWIMRRLRGRPHVLLKQRWDANYGHWLVEGLPRLALVEERFNLADLGFIVSGHHGAMQEVYEDSLALFGVRRDQIVEIGNEPVAVDRLIYPTPMTRHAWHIAPRCVNLLEQLATRVRADPGSHERIYVSRNRAGRRRLINEDEILAVVRSFGFTVVEPEFFSLYRQIGLFRNAKLVVGNYGAGLTNVAFAAGRPTLLALTSPFMQDDFFSTLMSLKQGRYLSLHGETSEPEAGMNADFRVDVTRFRRVLETLL